MKGLQQWGAVNSGRCAVVDLMRDNCRDWTFRGLKKRDGLLPLLNNEATTGEGVSPVREVPCPSDLAVGGPFIDLAGDADGASILLFYRTGTSEQRCQRATWHHRYGTGPIPLRPVERSAESFFLQAKLVLSEGKQGGES